MHFSFIPIGISQIPDMIQLWQLISIRKLLLMINLQLMQNNYVFLELSNLKLFDRIIISAKSVSGHSLRPDQLNQLNKFLT